MRYGLACSVLIAVTVLAAAACSSGTSSPPAGTASTGATAAAPASATASPAQPETAAAAKAAAARFFGLYTASQWAAAWTFLPPSTRQAVPQATWVAVHDGCPSASSGLVFQITNVTVTGSTAVVTYTLSGAAAGLGSATQAFTYSQGQWWLVLSDPGAYRHGSVKGDVAAMKAEGDCSGS
jgi:hypothetical protein